MIDFAPNSDAAPLSDDELDTLFDWLVPYFPLTLAVSGGVDSICLMHLIAPWLTRREALDDAASNGSRAATVGAPTNPDRRASRQPIQVVTVDHGLRARAAQEAEFVKQASLELGFTHTTLVWRGDKPKTGIQQAAREARYGLIARFLDQRQDRNSSSQEHSLVTAHHRDDQAETLVMRLARGSGLDGLAAMAGKSALHGMILLRPLLHIPKARLIATVKARGLSALEDPSNENTDFERVRLRQAGTTLAGAGLSNEMLALSARRLSRARAALDTATLELSTRAETQANIFGYGALSYGVFASAPEELRIRLLAKLVEFYGGAQIPVRLSKLEDLGAAIVSPEFAGATLNHCYIKRRGEKLLILREPGRASPNAQILAPGQSMLWDHRFLLSLSADFDEPMHIEHLGEKRWRALQDTYRAVADSGVLHHAALTLPVLSIGGELAAVPAFEPYAASLGGPLRNGGRVLNASHRALNLTNRYT